MELNLENPTTPMEKAVRTSLDRLLGVRQGSSIADLEPRARRELFEIYNQVGDTQQAFNEWVNN